MSTVSGIEVLSRAEAELRALIEAALASGQYNDVAALAHLADGVASLRSTSLSGNGTPPARPTAAHRSRHGAAALDERSTSGGRYARFERDGDTLIKIAGSGTSLNGGYEHRASFDVVQAVIATIKSKKGVGARFSATDILPLTHPKSRRAVPSYQTYLVIAWLRQEGVLIRHGRDGYSLKPTADSPEHIRKLWNALPSRYQA